MKLRTRTATLLATAFALACLPPAADPAAAAERADDSGVFAAYLVGHFAATTGDLPTAADAFDRAMRDDPSIPQLASQAFLTALLAGRPDAVSDAERLTNNPLAQLVVADAKARAGQWVDAEALYAALDEHQGLGRVLRPVLIAWSKFGQGEVGEALDTLKPFVAGQSLRGVYALHAAMIADLGGRPEQASQYYTIAQQDFVAPNLRLTQIEASWLARSGKLPEAQQAIDDLLDHQGELALAQTGLKADVAQQAVRNGDDGIAEAYLALAASIRPENPESALAIVHLALDMRPDLTAARILLSDIEDAAKQPDAALATLAPIVASDPLAPIVDLRRAALLADTGRNEAAIALLQRLATELPDQPDPLAQEGDILRRENKFGDAATAYSQAIARIGQPSRANWPLFYARGIALERSGDWDAAEHDLKFALELAPDEPNVLNYLAYSWTERGEHLDEARAMLDRAAAARPDDGAIIDSLGWLMLRQGNVPSAVERLTKAVEFLPEDATINGHLGDALAAAGRWREAEFQWRRALTLKPDEEDAKRINDRLAAMPTAAR